MQMSGDEIMYFDRLPSVLPIYECLREKLSDKYGDAYTVKVSKTQISLSNKHIFAVASLPYRRKKDWPREYLMVSFGLPCQKTSERIVISVEAQPNRWTHHVLIEREKQIDEELMGWIDEAYRFSAEK